MYFLDYAERHHPSNQLSFMLHELIFLGFILNSHLIRTRSHRIRIVVTLSQPYIQATVRMHSDAIFFAIGASQMTTFIKIEWSSTNSGSS